MRQVPRRHIPIAVAGSPDVGVGPVDLSLSGAGGVEGGASLPVQEHVVAGFWGVEISHGSGGCWGEGSPTGYPERLGCLARGVRGSLATDRLRWAMALSHSWCRRLWNHTQRKLVAPAEAPLNQPEGSSIVW